MSSGDQIAALIGVSMALVLSVRAYRSRQLSFERSAQMIVMWAVIIMVLAFGAARMGAR
ncbi:MAG: hypothetical protein ABIQ66_06960 [Novosphingobium sp.]